ncbi:filamentous hemagglutinin family N-terminal domain-containing protein, partial [Syntrophus gentianae]
MKREKQALKRQRKGRIQRSRVVALDASEQLRDAIRETGKKGALALGAATLATALLTGSAYALPKGEQLKAGNSTFSRPNATTLNITQTTKKSIINWQDYSIAAGESVRYTQPSSSAISLNRVTGSDPSKLYGSLSANGQVWVINPNGLLVGKNARITVGGFLASTLGLSDQDFLTGNYSFRGDASVGSILNSGEIQGGYVALISPSISNEGMIQASRGTVALASGEQVTLNFTGNDLVGFVVDTGTASSAGISNSGTLSGNSVLLTSKGASDVVRSVVNNTGVIEARSIEERNGEIVLAGDEVTNTGLVDASGTQGGTIGIEGGFVSLGGTISADGRTQGGDISVNSSGILSLADRIQARAMKGTGGQISYFSAGQTLESSTSVTDVSGKRDGGSIKLEAQGGLLSSGAYLASGTTGQGGRIDLSGYSVRLFSATVDASGGTQGGLVRIGGAFQGGKGSDPTRAYNDGFLTRWGSLDAISNAEKVFVNDATSIDVSADKAGSAGGTAVIWSNAETTMLGSVSAVGKASGGYVEVSSAELLRQADILKIDAGRGGEFLLDPKNIVIGDSDDVTGWSYQGILGKGYAGDKDVNVEDLDSGDGEESGDNFGVSVSLNSAGDRLAVGADCDEGVDNNTANSGAVYLFSFTDANFSGGSLQGIIGKGYEGGKNVNVSRLESGDFFGRSISLNSTGNRLAVGAYGDDGSGEDTGDSGAVYLFSFTDANFSGGTLQGIIGKGYTGGKNVDVSELEDDDNFGISVALNGAGNRLAVGATGDDGSDGTTTDSGAVYLFSFTDTNFSGGIREGIIGKGYEGGKNVDASDLEDSDDFGISVSLNNTGDRLAVGADGDDGSENDTADSGAAYLYSFTDTDFSGGILQGIIGKGYADGKNVGVADLEEGDAFGISVSLNDAGNRLAVGADGDDGSENDTECSGAVYLFGFTDTDFSGGSPQGMIGKGYSGDRDLDVDNLGEGDSLGRSVSLNGVGNRLAVGAWGDDGSDDSETDSGAVYLFSKYAYGDSSGESVNLLASDIATWLGGGSNLTLQASNDITLNSSITVNNASGNGGTLTLAAGRSLVLNGDITTDNGNLNLVANDSLANGVVDADREEGAAVITQASGTLIDAGTGAVTISLRDGSGKTYTQSGDITLSGINAAILDVTNAGPTADSDILQEGGTIRVTGTTTLTAG